LPQTPTRSLCWCVMQYLTCSPAEPPGKLAKIGSEPGGFIHHEGPDPSSALGLDRLVGVQMDQTMCEGGCDVARWLVARTLDRKLRWHSGRKTPRLPSRSKRAVRRRRRTALVGGQQKGKLPDIWDEAGGGLVHSPSKLTVQSCEVASTTPSRRLNRLQTAMDAWSAEMESA
jgi:hypothetical protein